MTIINLKISIIDIQKSVIECLISDKFEQPILLNYSPEDGTLEFEKHNDLSKNIIKYKFQFEKVIRSAIKGNISSGQTINCVFIDGFNFLLNTDFNKFILMDRRKGDLKISTSETKMLDTYKIYADGSFAEKTKQSAYGGFIDDPKGVRTTFSKTFDDGSNNLMELLAVTEGLQLLENQNRIQINTDSRFVIRGLIQWVHFWKHNNWRTAYDTEVKFAESWKKADQLCEGKILEFNWIKGHSGNKDQNYCHELAKQLSTQIKK